MPFDRAQAILEEMALRQRERERTAEVVRAIKGELFDKQLAVLDDPSREIGTLCTRRAGKTSLWSRAGTITALERPRTLTRMWAINRLRCKQLLWSELEYLSARHKLGVKFNDTELTAKFPNGSEIRLLGADKQKEAEKKRGDKTAMEVVLEAQGFGPYLRSIVEDIATPCLADLNGVFYLEGTPGPICSGYWYEISGGNDGSSRWTSQNGWSMHRWSVLDNPHLPHMRQWLAEHKLKKRWADDNPTYLREWLGKWVNDLEILFYAFDPMRNTFDYGHGPGNVEPWGPGWQHVLGWDLGSRDDMALVAWGFHPSLPDLYEAYSWKKPGAGIDEVIGQIDQLEQRGFKFTEMVADTQGGGKMFVEETMRRYPKYAFNAAKKNDKPAHVRLFNDELRTGHIKVKRGSPYAQEICELPKDPDWLDEQKEGKAETPPYEDPRFANHCCDAGLYAWRSAIHYLHREPPEPILVNTPRWYSEREKEFIAKIEARLKRDAEKSWLDNYAGDGSPDWME